MCNGLPVIDKVLLQGQRRGKLQKSESCKHKHIVCLYWWPRETPPSVMATCQTETEDTCLFWGNECHFGGTKGLHWSWISSSKTPQTSCVHSYSPQWSLWVTCGSDTPTGSSWFLAGQRETLSSSEKLSPCNNNAIKTVSQQGCRRCRCCVRPAGRGSAPRG